MSGTASTGPLSHTLRYGPQMEDEPVPGQVRHLLQRARLLEQVGRARHDLQACLPRQLIHRRTAEFQDDRVVTPTISNVGWHTLPRYSPARSGRPPRETTACTRFGRTAAATSAAAAPVLAPKSPTPRPEVRSSATAQSISAVIRVASRPMLNLSSPVQASRLSSAGVSRSARTVARPAACSSAAT